MYNIKEWISLDTPGKFEIDEDWMILTVKNESYKIKYKLYDADSIKFYYKDLEGSFFREVFDQDVRSLEMAV